MSSFRIFIRKSQEMMQGELYAFVEYMFKNAAVVDVQVEDEVIYRLISLMFLGESTQTQEADVHRPDASRGDWQDFRAGYSLCHQAGINAGSRPLQELEVFSPVFAVGTQRTQILFMFQVSDSRTLPCVQGQYCINLH